MEDLHKLYPEALPNIPTSKVNATSIDKKVAYFFKALKSIRDTWKPSQKWVAKYGYDKIDKTGTATVEQLVDLVFATLDSVIKAAAELFDMLKEDYSQLASNSRESCHNNKLISPVAKTDACIGVSPGTSKFLAEPLSPRVRVVQNYSSFKQKNETVENLKLQSKEEMRAENTGIIEFDLKTSKNAIVTISIVNEKDSEKQHEPTKLSEESVRSTTPPPVLPTKGSIPTAIPLKKGPGPPPPPPSAGKSLPQRKVGTKLKRSTQMPNLFRKLKDKMEGSNPTIKSANVRKIQLGGSADGKEGLAASLAELKKRSKYFLQIEEDIQNYAKPILELKIAINSFQTNDMVKLLKFQSNFETILGVLTDESQIKHEVSKVQVLAKFEGFPTKKLETLRTAAALYSKLDSILTTLKNWEIVPPLLTLLDKFEHYFRKVKEELDAFEQNQDEEFKKFKSNDIDFDFLIVSRVKESMLDLSSDCMELALKERKEAKTNGNQETGTTDQKTKGSVRMLWTVFQLAFHVYSFAGGLDDRHDKLAKELAEEILAD